MGMGTLYIAGDDWLWPAAILLLLGAGLILRNHWGSPLTTPIRWTGTLLKSIGLLALALCLLDPQWTSPYAKPGANQVLLVADNSRSMQLKDGTDGLSRGDRMRALLQPEIDSWIDKLDENFQLRRYQADQRLQRVLSFDELNFTGSSSDLFDALSTLERRHERSPVAGVVLLTDGNTTDEMGTLNLEDLPPIYPVVMGTDAGLSDVGIEQVSVTSTAFEDSPTTIQAQVRILGYGRAPVKAELLNREGVTLEEQTLRSPEDNGLLSFRFKPAGEAGDIEVYRLRVSVEGEPDPWLNPEESRESTLRNNQQLVAVNRGNGPYRVLYVGGRPNWEFKFLNRALQEDPELQLAWLIRIAKREPRFEFRGRAGESSNPLFRGFDQTGEETERFDQPVFRWSVPWEDDLLNQGFPTEKSELYKFHAVLIDDFEADGFTFEQMSLIKQFVSQRGGSFLMLGGAESFTDGGYQRSPIADLLPVYLHRNPTESAPQELALSLTREGWLESWTRLRPSTEAEQSRLGELPRLQVLNETRGIKPGASVLIMADDHQQQTHAALVTQHFGLGTSAALTIGDLWRTGLGDQKRQADLQKAWRQIIRRLVKDVPDRIELQVRPAPEEGSYARVIEVRTRDPEYLPLDNANISLSVQFLTNDFAATSINNAEELDDLQRLNLPIEPSYSEAGLHEATFIGRQNGVYVADATVTDEQGIHLGTERFGWTVNPAAEEFRTLPPNRALLAMIARKTGGAVIPASELSSWADRLPTKSAPITEMHSRPLWHQPLVFLLALTCFILEWGLRRWKGLP